MKSSFLAALAALTIASVSAHGNITWPPARLPGPAMLAACGQAAVDTVLGDGTIAIEEVKPASPACNAGLCRGAQFQDNAQNVQIWAPGQVVVVTIALPIPHAGPANVSIVETRRNTILGDMLLFFETYADEKLASLPANNTAFGVTLPTGADGDEILVACANPGDCVLQWWWLGTEVSQTYESCIDFVMVNVTDAAAVADGRANFTAADATASGDAVTATGGVVAQALPDVALPAAPVAADAPTPVPVAVVPEGSFGGVFGAIPVSAVPGAVKRFVSRMFKI